MGNHVLLDPLLREDRPVPDNKPSRRLPSILPDCGPPPREKSIPAPHWKHAEDVSLNSPGDLGAFSIPLHSLTIISGDVDMCVCVCVWLSES